MNPAWVGADLVGFGLGDEMPEVSAVGWWSTLAAAQEAWP